ncbi:MAG: carbohydrate kinase family protein [Trueperaceae bacterium]|nr:carbohydrate kinase family protein [Trueperaceae bacterium]MCO5174025.1 carbohydrate kinase family protein [Trueperaceae bacterium]MCW5820961.1 carbohydrate kinase family protein [Trueperaceae bacterium]
MAHFFVVGDATVDQMYFVREFPDPGGEVSAIRAVMQPGGSGGTVATVLARLGNKTRIATRVGVGPFSELALRNLAAAGVDMRLVQKDEVLQTSSVTLIITPDAQRTMISAAGASRHLDSAELREEAIADCDALVMSAYSLMGGPQKEYALQALNLARKHKLTTFVDLGTGAVRALQERLIPALRGIDYWLMNERELYLLTGRTTISEAVRDLREDGIEQIVVKVGAMGSIVINSEFTELVEAHEIDNVIDSTGAGDYYTAAFAHAIMAGHDLYGAARLGNVAGALNTTVVGAQSLVLDAATLERHAAIPTDATA